MKHVHTIFPRLEEACPGLRKRTYPYTRDNYRYQLFLKKHILSLTPDFYSVVFIHPIDTTDGKMFAVSLRLNEINNPEYEAMAECWINNEFIYLWREKCWGIAVNDQNESRSWYYRATMPIDVDIDVRTKPCDKDLILYEIGSDTVE